MEVKKEFNVKSFFSLILFYFISFFLSFSSLSLTITHNTEESMAASSSSAASFFGVQQDDQSHILPPNSSATAPPLLTHHQPPQSQQPLDAPPQKKKRNQPRTPSKFYQKKLQDNYHPLIEILTS